MLHFKVILRIFKLWLFVISAIIIFAGAVFSQEGQYFNCLKLYKEKNYFRAITCLEDFINSNPNHSLAYRKLVEVYRDVDKLQQGELFLKNLIKIVPDSFNAYWALGLVYSYLDKDDEAIGFTKKAITIKPDDYDACKNLAIMLRTKDGAEVALAFFDNILKTQKSNASAYYAKGYIYNQESKWDLALQEIQKSIALNSNLLEGYILKIIVLRNLGNYNEALKVCDSAFKMIKEKNDSEAEAKILSEFSKIYWYTGELDQALKYAEETLPIYEETVNKNGIMSCLNIIGLVSRATGDYDKALDIFRKSLNIDKEANDLYGQSVDLSNIGDVYFEMGEFGKAIEHYRESLEIVVKTDDKMGEATTLGAIASTLAYQGNYSESIEYSKKAIEISRAIGYKSCESNDLGNLGITYLELNDYDKALDHLDQALQIAYEIGEIYKQYVFLGNLGSVYLAKEDYSKALEYTERARKMADEQNDPLNSAVWTAQIGNIHLKLKKYSKALERYNQALPVFLSIGDQRNEVLTYHNIAQIYIEQNKTQQAEKYLLKAIEKNEKMRALLARYNEKVHFYENKIKIYNDLIGLYFKQYRQKNDSNIIAKAFYYGENAKARSLLDILSLAEIKLSKGVSPKISEDQKQIFSNISKIQTELLDEEISEEKKSRLKDELRTEEQKLEDLQARIYKNSPAYARLKDPKPVSLIEIQKEINKDEILLEFFLCEPASFLLAISRNDISFLELPSSKVIEEKVQKYLSVISKPPASGLSFNTLGKDLFNMLLKPQELKINDHKSLIIAPDGILHYLPFETLIYEIENKRPVFLIEKNILTYAPSASVLKYLRDTNQSNKANYDLDLVAFGDPVFNNENQNNIDSIKFQEKELSLYETRGFNFCRLPYTSNEINSIAAVYPQSKIHICLRETALEENFKSMQPISAKTIHFATHGLIDEQYPQRSCIVLNLDNDPSEDGLLQMNEIFNMEMETDLVVLSACQTGKGKLLRGEGVLSLTRAFLYAGARSVIVSMWTVNDRSTVELMDKFYKYRLKCGSVSKALQLAKKDLINGENASLRHPYYWAPFIYIGNSL